MPILTMTKGLPASGKSTWAKQEVIKSKGRTKRINKDDLRDMIDAGVWGKNNEKNILSVRNLLIKHYLDAGFNVIVDDTNLHPKHETTLQQIADICNVRFVVKSFLDVPMMECIKRDLGREKSVGERIIRSMYNQFLKPNVAQYKHNDFLPYAIICDIDGTIAHMEGRSPYDESKVLTDSVDETVVDILRHYADEVDILLVSGRHDTCQADTVAWLAKHDIPYTDIHMRKEGDDRKDFIVKQEIFDEYIRNQFNVLFVLDDRNQVIEMWRGLGLKVLQVAEGDF